jgi:hypothetical protein
MKWALKVASSPRRYILWPASIAFILSYSTIYVLFSDLLPNAGIPGVQDGDADIYIRQALILPPAFSNALNNDVFQALDSFIHLHAADVVGNDTSSIGWVQSIGRDVSKVDFTDREYLQTVLYTPKLIGNADIHTNNQLSASGLLISYVYYNSESAIRWKDAVSSLLGQTDYPAELFATSTLLPNANTDTLSTTSPNAYNFFPACPLSVTMIIVSYTVAMLYIWIALSGFTGVLSQAGLAIAFVVQLLLSIFSSLTITSVIFPSFSQYHIRQFMALPYLVSLMGAEHMLRLVNSISKTPSENSPLARISSAVEMSAPKAIQRVVVSCLILSVGCMPCLGFSSNAKALCIFTIIAMLLDLVLHFSFFIAVLSVDLRRLELQDVFVSSPSSPIDNTVLPHQDLTTNNSPLSKDLNFHIRAFVYFRRIYLKQRIPQITMFASCALVGVYLFLASQGVMSQGVAVDHPTGKFAYFLNPLVQSGKIAELRDKNVLVYEPIVIYARCHPMSKSVDFALGNPLKGSLTPGILDLLSLHLFLEFVASLAFILSLTGIILKFILPKSIEIPDDQEFSDTAQFFSKDLVDYNALDILRIIIHESWIATLSLDHKVFVWNAAAINSRTKQATSPVQVPLPETFWPVYKVVMNGTSGLIALFSPKIPAVLVWNFKKNCQEYFFHNEQHLSTLPVDAFFSGMDLIVITRNCTLLSIPPHGDDIGVFPIKLSDPGSKLVSATRLLTPKINEQVVCVSSSNDIIVGTHTNYLMWTFEKIDLLESMAAIPKSERDPLFSSQFTDEFSVQMSRELTAPPLAHDDSQGGKRDKLFIPSTRPIQLEENIASIIPVPDIHMVMLTTSMTASLLDVQTGTILQHFRLGHFKKGSLRVFHSQPTHCRFCGCASVESISVAYADAEDDSTIIVHTLMVENRAKNNICLRVERDPREKRCLGFEAATEHQHWINNVEGWDTTDMNMIMGVRRKEDEDRPTPRPQSIIDDFDLTPKRPIGTSAVSLFNNTRPSTLTKRTGAGGTRQRITTTTNEDLPSKRPPLNITWEGWAMSATGQVSYYDIPDFEGGPYGRVKRQQLLIQTIGPVTKYGRKSIAVAFGNVIKILYFGNEESFLTDVEQSNRLSDSARNSNSTSPANNNSNNNGLITHGAKKWRRTHTPAVY